MPFTGGFSPSPERYGGGNPNLQRILESLNQQRGTAYDVTSTSTVYAENLALARCLDEVWETNQRLANQFDPNRMTTSLGRWETILGIIPLPTDTPVDRRKRIAALFARIGLAATIQAVQTQLTNLLGSMFIDLEFQNPSNALLWWPGLNGNAASIISAGSTSVTVTGLVGVLPAWYGMQLTLTNCANANNNITSQQIIGTPSAVTVAALDPSGGTSPDYGVGGTIGSPTIQWSVVNPATPFYSTIAHILIKVQKLAAQTEAQFYQAMGQIFPLLDSWLPAWVTWDWYRVDAVQGVKGFYLDSAHNLDNDVFDV